MNPVRLSLTSRAQYYNMTTCEQSPACCNWKACRVHEFSLHSDLNQTGGGDQPGEPKTKDADRLRGGLEILKLRVVGGAETSMKVEKIFLR